MLLSFENFEKEKTAFYCMKISAEKIYLEKSKIVTHYFVSLLTINLQIPHFPGRPRLFFGIINYITRMPLFSVCWIDKKLYTDAKT